ncbi:MAG: hypothetical protein M1831_001203 [Alyxoria varia]|nr:MAG: hypothetical protein M1831_001203 [Alyxoria varia]
MARFSILKAAVSALAFAATLVGAQGAQDVQEEQQLEKRQSGTFAIRGATGGVATRLEVRRLAADSNAWNLFLLAMRDLKGLPQNQLLSYYQIAGVHGVPNIPWDGVRGNANQGVGYCTHANPIFPSWHRAYMALFDQAFQTSVNRVVNQFQGAARTRFSNAARNLRVPYWDWAANYGGSAVLPASMTNKFVTLETPSGRQNVLNPLFRYDTHPLDRAGFLTDPWDAWPVTLRYPNSTDPVRVASQNNLATARVNQDNPSLRQRIYQLFANCRDYRGFSNSNSNVCGQSLEAVHNNIHNDIGGPNGHMTILWYAAFDPSFWLHHANVDRLYALWQAIYPNSYTINAPAGQSTYTIRSGDQMTANTPLRPFHSNSNGAFHTSNSVRNVRNLGYTYPELSSGDTSPAGVRAKVNNLYGPGARRVTKRDSAPFPIVARAEDDEAAADLTPTISASPSSGPPQSLKNATLPEDYDFTTNIVSEGYSLGGSYNVYLFLGEPESDEPTTWGTDSNCLGTHASFSAPGMHSRTLIRSHVPLNAALNDKFDKGEIKSLDRKVVLPYLEKNLQWKVMKSTGEGVPNDHVPGLTVGVQSAKVKPAKSRNEFPTVAHYEDHQECTHGKSGGVQQGMANDWYKRCAPVDE